MGVGNGWGMGIYCISMVSGVACNCEATGDRSSLYNYHSRLCGSRSVEIVLGG